MTSLVLDTSAAVALLLRSHRAVRRHASGRAAALTRLPADARVAPPDAVRLLEANFSTPLPVPPDELDALPRVLAARGIAGGAVYDALVGLAARAAAVPLLTRDGRAMATYAALDVEVELVSG